MSLEDKEIIAEFVAESREHLADIENQLLAIEAGGADIDSELVNKVFRAVHSIKGAAGFFGFAKAQELAHELENILNLFRNRQLVPTPAMTDVLLRAADRLRAMVEDIEHSNEVDVAGHVAELRAVAAAQPPAAASPQPAVGAADQPSAETPPVEEGLALVEDLVEQAASESLPVVPAVSPAAAPPAEAVSGCPQEPKPSPAQAESNIRVAVRVLDHLMNLAGELVLSRNQLLQAVAGGDRESLDSVSSRVNQVTSELQETIMQTRLQVVDTVFHKFPRVVRDLSNTLGKQCELTVEGEDVELDKSIIEAIGDPLTHLIRNAVDHGIESPEARLLAGKPAKGKILLKAFHQAGKVNIVVADDGSGMDVAKLKAKAVARGILTAEQARNLADREALRLIFRPGFSMAEKVTNVSGRGVGMDVVRANIERLSGTVDVDTEPGAGTTVAIKLPLTLAIIPSLIVGCRRRRFAIPQASISELVRIKAADVSARLERVHRAEVFRLRGDLLPVVRLGAVLGLDGDCTNFRGHHSAAMVDGAPSAAWSGTVPLEPGPRQSTAAGAVSIIVVDTGRLRYGLIVDSLHDSEEIVVKPLGKHVKGCSCFAGATVLGDGNVALILDTAGIAAAADLAAQDAEDAAGQVKSAPAAGEETQSLLLFTNAPAEQFGIPMELIARLERVRSEQIDTVGGQAVLQYRGSALPLLSLERHIKAAPRQEQRRLYVVVYKVMQREVGLVVPELLDIRSVSTRIDTVTFREPGVIGSLVLDGRTTRLLDLYELTETAHPEWFRDRQAVRAAQADPCTILLAEDSDFFRKQLTTVLQSDGHEVISCEDGQAAWDLLQEPGRRFDLVVTDLEMPRLNGFELTHKIKTDPSRAHLPVIAVTSLASDEDIARGRKAGVDEYLIKLDRERLTAAVSERLQAARRGVKGTQASRPAAGTGSNK